jgi:hypothetical protein
MVAAMSKNFLIPEGGTWLTRSASARSARGTRLTADVVTAEL